MDKKMQHKEFDLQVAIATYLNYKYKSLIFRCDTAAMFTATLAQKARIKKLTPRSGFKMPDMYILQHGRIGGKIYSGLFLELKIEPPYKKDGSLKKNPHLEMQEKSLEMLKKQGFYAIFVWSFDDAISIIDEYLSAKQNETF